MCGEEACCSHFTLLAKPGSALQWKVLKSLNFCEETAAFHSILLCSQTMRPLLLRAALDGHWLVVAFLLAHCVAQFRSLSAVLGMAVPVWGGFLLLCSSLWGRAGCPELCRMRLPLDVAEEVEQHSSEGSDSAFSFLANYCDPSNFLVCSIFSLFFFPFSSKENLQSHSTATFLTGRAQDDSMLRGTQIGCYKFRKLMSTYNSP